ncbi:MAG: hypothetical protein QNJ65_24770 [Xenococcaceae cyanobacterium MO_234.B1]|nr:hypothetical protein [Xenococcaceae cyanobacterium MO_234.B1]
MNDKHPYNEHPYNEHPNEHPNEHLNIPARNLYVTTLPTKNHDIRRQTSQQPRTFYFI